MKMRKVLIIARGLTSLAILAGARSAAAQYEDKSCSYLAFTDRLSHVCTVSADGKTKVCKTVQARVDFIYNRCVSAKAQQAAQQKAARQQVQNAINTAQTPTGILGSGRAPKHAH